MPSCRACRGRARSPCSTTAASNAKTGQWTGPPSLIQFRNIYIKELP